MSKDHKHSVTPKSNFKRHLIQTEACLFFPHHQQQDIDLNKNKTSISDSFKEYTFKVLVTNHDKLFKTTLHVANYCHKATPTIILQPLVDLSTVYKYLLKA